MMAKPGRIPDGERWARIERLLNEVGLDVREIAAAFGLSRAQAYRWQRQARATARRARLVRASSLANTTSGMLMEGRHRAS